MMHSSSAVNLSPKCTLFQAWDISTEDPWLLLSAGVQKVLPSSCRSQVHLPVHAGGAVISASSPSFCLPLHSPPPPPPNIILVGAVLGQVCVDPMCHLFVWAVLGQVCVNLVCHLVVWAVLGQVCGNWMCDFFVWAVFGQVCINPVCHLVLWAVLRQVCANLGSLLFVWALLKQVRVNPVVSPLMWAVFEQVCVNWCVIFLCEQCWDKSVLSWCVTLWFR